MIDQRLHAAKDGTLHGRGSHDLNPALSLNLGLRRVALATRELPGPLEHPTGKTSADHAPGDADRPVQKLCKHQGRIRLPIIPDRGLPNKVAWRPVRLRSWGVALALPLA